MKLIYIAGPYTADNVELKYENISRAEKLGYYYLMQIQVKVIKVQYIKLLIGILLERLVVEIRWWMKVEKCYIVD